MSGADVRRKLRLGPFELSIGERILRRDGQVLPLGGRAPDNLIYLADRPGEVIAKQQLIDRLTNPRHVAGPSRRPIQGATNADLQLALELLSE